MTRWVRSGSTQKHKKMPGDATKWGEFDNQNVRKVSPKNNKNIDSQTDKEQNMKSSNNALNFSLNNSKSSLPSNSHDNTINRSLEESFFEEDEKIFSFLTNTNISDEEKEEENDIVTEKSQCNVTSSFIDRNNDNINMDLKKMNRKKKKKIMKKQAKIKHSSLAEEINNAASNDKCKRFKAENGCTTENQGEEMTHNLEQEQFDDLSKNSGSLNIPSSQKCKKKHKKKKNNYNSNESEIDESVEKPSPKIFKKRKSVHSLSFEGNSDEFPSTKHDVDINSPDKIAAKEPSFEDANRSPKKQKKKNLINNQTSENSTSKGFESKKEMFLKRLQKKREKLGITFLPAKVERKLYNIRKKLREKGYPPQLLKEIMRKERRKEELKFRKTFNPSKLCFNCRQPGHIFADCPKKSESLKQETGICFKCGSVEHTSFKCPKKVQGFPFAKCFICKEQGHISKDCPKNKHGVYPKGGRCNLCGNVNHLKKDCPSLKKKENEEENITLHTLNENASIDAEMIEKEEIKKKSVKKAKIVKF